MGRNGLGFLCGYLNEYNEWMVQEQMQWAAVIELGYRLPWMGLGHIQASSDGA